MRQVKWAAAAAVALTLTACGGDSTAPDTEGLDPAEAEALSSVIVSQAIQAGFSAMGSAFGPQLIPFSESVDGTQGCAMGGTVSVSGGLDGDVDISGAGTLTMNLQMVHQGCRLQDPATGYVFTIDGAPNLTATLDMQTFSDGSATMTGGNSGTVRWDLSGRTGSCVVSILWNGSVAAGGTTEVSVSGTVCGDPI